MRHHPASPDYHRTLFNSVNHHPIVSAIGSVFGGGSSPAAPVPVAAPAAPSVDQATVNVDQQAQSDQAQAAKKGALSTLLTTGNTETGQQLGEDSPETTLKRFLG